MASKQRLLRMLIFGAPGSGKGTISSWIERDFGLKQVSSGDILRQNVMRGTEIGKLAESYMKKGDMVPDDVMVKLISGELSSMEGKSWLLDGFPRTIQQARAFDKAQDEKNQPVDSVFFVDVPEQVIVDRIKGRYVHLASGRVYNTDFSPPKREGLDDITGEPLTKRHDDTPEVVRARLAVFRSTSEPVLEHYRSKGILQHFVGDTSDAIYKKIKPLLLTMLKK